MPPNNASEPIPLHHVVSHSSTSPHHHLFRFASSTTQRVNLHRVATINEKMDKNAALFDPHTRGRRRLHKTTSGRSLGTTGYDGEEDTINWMGRFYYGFMGFSIVTRYFIYVLPLGLLLAVPIVVGATGAKDAAIDGVRIVWLFTWFEVVWLSLWAAKILAHFLPHIFIFFAGVVSAGTRKYGLVLSALQLPISFALWAVTSLATFTPLMINNPDTHRLANAQSAAGKARTADTLKSWQSVIRQLLGAGLVVSLIFLAERFLIQLLSLSYHRKQFNAKIIQSKHNVYLLGLMYDASRALFPMFCNEFAKEDYLITDSLDLAIPGLTKSNVSSDEQTGSSSPIRILQNAGRFGDKVTTIFCNIASEITGKQVFNPNAAHSVVVEALERHRSSEALAKRLWMSFVVEGKDALYPEDIREVLGAGKEEEAVECFCALDRDGNGDISLDEMILCVTEIGRERKSVANSMLDVDQAIKALDALLTTIVFVISVFVLIAFLNRSFVTTLATAATALLSLSFVFAVTCQEVLGSCIFLFVKHPYDIGDRVDIDRVSLTVEHISLLFTVFKRVDDGMMVQIPNIVLNTLWVNNVTRSKAMREKVSIFVSFKTSFEDIKTLRQELQTFVTDRDNARDFQPKIKVEVIGIAEMNKLELCVEIRHKSNWHNETIRAARRSRFMCALVRALRKVPIYAPGGGDALLGEIGKPTYTVAISPDEALQGKAAFAAAKEAKRLYPTKKPDEAADSEGGRFDRHETKAVDELTSRAPNADFARDDVLNMLKQNVSIDSSNTLSEAMYMSGASPQSGLVASQSKRGKRKTGDLNPLNPTPSGGSENRPAEQQPNPLGSNPSLVSVARRSFRMVPPPASSVGAPPGSGGPYVLRPGSGGSGNGAGYKPAGPPPK